MYSLLRETVDKFLKCRCYIGECLLKIILATLRPILQFVFVSRLLTDCRGKKVL